MGIIDRFRARPTAEQPKATASEAPRGGSGRGHTSGFLELEEFNAELRHPASHRVYDRMYRTDADVRQVLQLAVNPITGGTWEVQPYGGEEASKEDTEVAEAVRWALFEVMAPNLIGHLIEFLPVVFRSGFCPGEVVWAPVEREGKKLLCPARIEMRLPRSVWRFHQANGRLSGITQYLPSGGGSGTDGSLTGEGPAASSQSGGGSGSGDVFIPARDLVYYRVGAEGDNWEGVSLLRPAYKHWKIKDAVERIDAIAQEREAIGIPVLYAPPSADTGQLDELEGMLRAMRSNEQSYIVMPGQKAGEGAPEGQGWLLEILGYDRTGSGRDPRPTLDYHTNKIAAAFIAEFMRLGHGQTGARATAQVQADPFLMSIEALVTGIEQSLNETLVLPFVAHNFSKAANAPKLKMSLVDSTSLSSLADFVLKLTQVGALLPDQELEDFMRARADLPPANPEAVKRRKAEDDKIRRMIVGGDPEAQVANDPFGANDSTPGHHGDRKGGVGQDQPKKVTGAPKGEGGRGQGAPRGPATGPPKQLDTVTLSAAGDSVRYAIEEGRVRDFELACDMHGIADEFDGAGGRMRDRLKPHVVAGADEATLAEAIGERLSGHYASGAKHVCRELGIDSDATTVLARGVDRGAAGIGDRARIAARHVHHSMEMARETASLDHGDGHHAQAAAEQAGLRAAERVGRSYGVQAFLQGRHDAGVQLADSIVGARYTAIMDAGTCESCDEADDGVVRPLDDPIRQDRRPPNRHCHSTRGGHNLCRCFEVYEPMPPDGLELADMPVDPQVVTPGWPPLIAKMVTELLASRPGMDVSRALRITLNRLRVWSQGGQRVSASVQQAAAEALAAWAQAHG